MLNVKYLCKLTAESRRPTILKACQYLGNPVYFECEFGVDEFFDLLYGNSFNSSITRPFKVNRSG